MSGVIPVHGKEISLKFQNVINSSRGGELIIVTPFITDFELKGEKISSCMLKLARLTTKISLMVAPPSNPHKHNTKEEMEKCKHCKEVVRKIALLDIYEKFAEEILIKENLHAKIFLSKDSNGKYIKCLAGSANLTLGGFRDHCELCFFIEDKLIIKKINSFIETWKTSRHGPKAERYRIWKKNLLSKYPDIKYLLQRR